MPNIVLSSTAFKNNEFLPKQYTCDGENKNPPLTVKQIPIEAQSLTLIVDDPDSPTGNFVHWMVWNIPPQYDHIPEGSPPPSSIQGINDFGEEGYGGPCPPPGPEHRFFFKVYVLDTILELPKNTKKSLLEKSMEGHILAQITLIGLYGRGR